MLYVGLLGGPTGDDPESGRWYTFMDDPDDFMAISMGIDLNTIGLSTFSFRATLSAYSVLLKKGERPPDPYFQDQFEVDKILGPKFPANHFDG